MLLDVLIYNEGRVEAFANPMMAMLAVPWDTLIHNEGPVQSFAHPVTLMMSMLGSQQSIALPHTPAELLHLLYSSNIVSAYRRLWLALLAMDIGMRVMQALIKRYLNFPM